MRNVIKLAAAGVLAGFAVNGASAADMKKVSISTIVEVPALIETKQGVVDALAERGYIEGKTIEIDYQNANGNMPTQQQIAKKFVGDNPDVIVPITTPTSQAMVTATKDLPIVFVSVTDPVKARLITNYEKSGTNVTGVSDEAPIVPQLELFKKLVPGLTKIGFVYNPGLDNSLSTLEQIKKHGKEFGITVVESPAPTTNEVLLATKKLIGKVDAIYIPNDTTVVAALEAVVKIGQDVDLPVFTGETGGVERGAVGSIGLDYTAVGRVAGMMAADVLDGKKPGEIDPVRAYKAVEKFKVVFNKGSAEKMGVTIPDELLATATQIIE